MKKGLEILEVMQARTSSMSHFCMYATARASLERTTGQSCLSLCLLQLRLRPARLLQLISSEVKKKKPTAAKLTELSNRFYQVSAISRVCPSMLSASEMRPQCRLAACNLLGCTAFLWKSLKGSVTAGCPVRRRFPTHSVSGEQSLHAVQVSLQSACLSKQ